MKKKCILILASLLVFTNVFSHNQHVLKLSPQQVEALFLKQNLQLIAEQMNVDIADAAIAQAKLWENPELSIGSLNLWSTSNQREGESEFIPPLFGSFAKNTQFSIELSQLVQTANKRGKLIKRERVSKELTIQEFEEVLRGMKLELRKSINEIIYLQAYNSILLNQGELLDKLILAYTKQVAQGNIAKSELLRLQSSALEIENEINEVQTDLNEQQKNIKALLNADPFIIIEIEDSTSIIKNPENINLANLFDLASDTRPDIKWRKLQTEYFNKSLAYEKSLRVPDLNFNINYDRHGGVWRDFVGFGVSFNLPFLNRNQGNIKAAKVGKTQSEYLLQQQQNIAQHEVAEAFSNYTQAYKFHQKITENTLLADLDSMLEVYTKNLINKNISMLEYVDFMDAYKTNKQTIFGSKKKANSLFEELQYTLGSEIK